jgi:hypothetical protein
MFHKVAIKGLQTKNLLRYFFRYLRSAFKKLPFPVCGVKTLLGLLNK